MVITDLLSGSPWALLLTILAFFFFAKFFQPHEKILVVVSWFHNTVICFVLHHYAGSFPLAFLNTDIKRWSAGDLFWISTWSANKGNTKIDKFHQNICKSSGQGRDWPPYSACCTIFEKCDFQTFPRQHNMKLVTQKNSIFTRQAHHFSG